VDDQPDVRADPDRPKIPVAGLVELVKLHPRAAGVELEVKGRRLDGLLFVTGEAGEGVSECVGNAEIQATMPI